MPTNSNYFEDVYEVVRLVPAGRVTSYGAIANYLSLRSGARMVGWALNQSLTNGEPVPAHRVVNRKGLLSGKNHFETPTRMQELLEAEGIAVENDQVVNFERLFWDPAQELI